MKSEGGKWEMQVLGRCAFIRPGRVLRYMPFKTALRASKLHQYDWDPANPRTDIGKDLFMKVSYEIWNRTNVVYRSLRFFATLGGPADWYHGVDCYLEINGGRSAVLIDLTNNAEKITPRSDSHLFFRPSDLDDRDPFCPVGSSFVTRVVDILLDPNRSVCLD